MKNKDNQDRNNYKKEIIKCGRTLIEKYLVIGPGGNISFRIGDLAYITPSGIGFDELNEDDIVGINIDSKKIVEGMGVPSSEVSMHRDTYIL